MPSKNKDVANAILAAKNEVERYIEHQIAKHDCTKHNDFEACKTVASKYSKLQESGSKYRINMSKLVKSDDST